MAPSSLNDSMVRALQQEGFADGRVAKAMRKADRALFVPENERSSAYAPIPLPIGHGQTISAPTIVAQMSTLLQVKEGMNILEVGAGSGYQAAVLAELAGRKGKVTTIDRIAELLEQAKANCAKAGYSNIQFICGNGARGYEKNAPYDRILVAAAALRIPPALTAQLQEGGRMLIPVGRPDYAELLILRKLKGGEIKAEKVTDVMFVPLVDED
jgi:protein-L-isoaspartate(D-aspartate) O-methyltransferase